MRYTLTISMRVIQIANEKVPFEHFYHRPAAKRNEPGPAGRNLCASVSPANVTFWTRTPGSIRCARRAGPGSGQLVQPRLHLLPHLLSEIHVQRLWRLDSALTTRDS